MITARLMHKGVPVSEERPLVVGPETLDIVVNTPGEFSVADAALTVTAADGSKTTPIGREQCTVATSCGTGYSDQAVTWVTIEWGVRRTLADVTVVVDGALPDGVEGRLKLSEHGPWYAPSPSNLALAHRIRLPALNATRMMIEFVRRAGDVLVPAAVRVKHVNVSTFACPSDLSLSLGEKSPFAVRDQAFRPSENWTVRSAFSEALRAVLEDDQHDPTQFLLRLRSQAPGIIAGIALELTTARQLQTWANRGTSCDLDIEPDTLATAVVDVPTNAEIERIECRVHSEFARERCLSTEPTGPSTAAHRCRPGMFAAQSIPPLPLGSKVSGIDVQLRMLSPMAVIKLYAHVDCLGQPDAEPVVGGAVVLETQVSGNAPWPMRWVSFDLSAAVVPPGRPWWIVLKVEQGDLLWSVDPVAVDDLVAARTLYRNEGESWHERRLPPAQNPGQQRAARARARVRLVADRRPEPSIKIQLGRNEIVVQPDDAGRIVLDGIEVEKLYQEALDQVAAAAIPLTFFVRTPIRGTVCFSELCVRLKPTKSSFRF